MMVIPTMMPHAVNGTRQTWRRQESTTRPTTVEVTMNMTNDAWDTMAVSLNVLRMATLSDIRHEVPSRGVAYRGGGEKRPMRRTASEAPRTECPQGGGEKTLSEERTMAR